MNYCFRLTLLFAVTWASVTAFSGQQPVLNSALGESPATEEPGQPSASQPVDGPHTEREEISQKLRVAQRVLDSPQETAKQQDAEPPERLQREYCIARNRSSGCDFGDNALIFELHFWIEARTVAERRRIESDIRYRIDQLSRSASLVIAFPQRDMHVDTTQPLEARLFPPTAQTERVDDATPHAA